MASDAIFGLIGVVVGGVLTGGADFALERSREKRRARASARLIHDALTDMSTFLEASIGMRTWLEDPKKVLSTQAWDEQRGCLAEAPGFDGWYPVSAAWSFIDNARQRVTQSEEEMGDDPFQQRDPEYFRLGLMAIGVAEKALVEYAKTRTYQDSPASDSDDYEAEISMLFEKALEKEGSQD